MSHTQQQKLIAEAVGTFMLLATVVGSGIMGEALAQGNTAVALLGNTIPTGAILFVLITMLGPISGAHFNPAVTLAFWLRGEFPAKSVLPYIGVQVIAGIAGVLVANAMFDLDLLQTSLKVRSSVGQWLSEIVATFGLVLAILVSIRTNPKSVAMVVGLYITAAYWFTASTSFANPAVTIARMFSDTFAGISPADTLMFILCQLIGMGLALVVARLLESKA